MQFPFTNLVKLQFSDTVKVHVLLFDCERQSSWFLVNFLVIVGSYIHGFMIIFIQILYFIEHYQF